MEAQLSPHSYAKNPESRNKSTIRPLNVACRLSLLLEQLPEEQEMKNLLTQVRGASLAVLEIYLSRMWLAHVESVSFVAYLLGPGGEPAVELQICCHHSTTSKERSRSAVHLLHTQHRSVDASSMNNHCRFILL